MAVAGQYFEFDKAQRNKLLITEDPSLMFSIIKVARDQTQPGSLFARSRGGKMRDPGNEVGSSDPCKYYTHSPTFV